MWEVEERSKAECTRRNQGKRGDERRKNERNRNLERNAKDMFMS